MKLFCIKCACIDARIKFDLYDEEMFVCSECDEEFNVDEVKDAVESLENWKKVLEWVGQFPSEASEDRETRPQPQNLQEN